MKLPMLRALALAKPPAPTGCQISELAEKNNSNSQLPSPSLFLPPPRSLAAPNSEQAQNSPCKDEQIGKHHQTHEKMQEFKAEVHFEESEKVPAYEIKSLPGRKKDILQQIQRQKNIRFDN